jgi:hypothetical protein
MYLILSSRSLQELTYRPQAVIDPQTLLTRLRNVPRGSDFFELKEALSYKLIE